MSDPVVKPVRFQPAEGPEERHWLFYCPGCECHHQFDARWSRSGPDHAPTFSPSLVSSPGTKDMCHLFVRSGRIEYCGDSHHAMAGQTVDMLPME